MQDSRSARFTSPRSERVGAEGRSVRRRGSGWRGNALLLLALVASACQININGVPLAQGRDLPDHERADAEPAHDAEVTPSDGAVEGEGAPDAEQLSDGGDGSDAARALRHPSCQQASTATDLTSLLVDTDARGRPSFDWWRDLSCEEVAGHETCTLDLNGRSARCEGCLRSADDADVGLCVKEPSPLFCDDTPNHGVIALASKACLFCGDNRLHRYACCHQIEGFDCRSWPFPGNSGPQGLCARHADCEPGLMCKTGALGRFATCMCPETEQHEFTECPLWTQSDPF